jgi:hypothetical protein
VTWFRVDDGFWSHPKVIECPDSAIGLWVKAGAYSAQHLTDGVISKAAASVLRAKKRDICALIAAGLWQECDGGWRFHEWENHQPSREQVHGRRAKTAERVARWRAGQASDVTPDERRSNGVTDGVTNGVSNAAPDPTRPDPTRKEVATSPLVGGAGGDASQAPPAQPKRRDVGHRLPDEWMPSEKTRTDLQAKYERQNSWWWQQLEEFGNHFRAKTGKDARKADWDLTFRNWIHEAVRREGGGRGGNVRSLNTQTPKGGGAWNRPVILPAPDDATGVA